MDASAPVISTLSLHDALPIWVWLLDFDLYCQGDPALDIGNFVGHLTEQSLRTLESEEHTSELQSHHDLVCRLLLEKKNYQLAKHTARTIATEETTSIEDDKRN